MPTDFIIERISKSFTKSGTVETTDYIRIAGYSKLSFTSQKELAAKMTGKFANEVIAGVGRQYNLKRVICT